VLRVFLQNCIEFLRSDWLAEVFVHSRRQAFLPVRIAEQDHFRRPGQGCEYRVQPYTTAAGSTAGARDACPERAERVQSPGKMHTGQKVEPGVVAVFEFCPYLQACTIRPQRDLILHKQVEKMHRRVGWDKRLVHRTLGIVGGVTISHSPNDILSIPSTTWL
jgi:hypothetical protein